MSLTCAVLFISVIIIIVIVLYYTYLIFNVEIHNNLILRIKKIFNTKHIYLFFIGLEIINFYLEN